MARPAPLAYTTPDGSIITAHDGPDAYLNDARPPRAPSHGRDRHRVGDSRSTRSAISQRSQRTPTAATTDSASGTRRPASACGRFDSDFYAIIRFTRDGKHIVASQRYGGEIAVHDATTGERGAHVARPHRPHLRDDRLQRRHANRDVGLRLARADLGPAGPRRRQVVRRGHRHPRARVLARRSPHRGRTRARRRAHSRRRDDAATRHGERRLR